MKVAFSHGAPCFVLPILLLFLILLSYTSPLNQINGFTNFFSAFTPQNRSIGSQEAKRACPLVVAPAPAAAAQLQKPNSVFEAGDNMTPIRRSNKKSSLERIEDGLAAARAAILEAIRLRNYTSKKEETFILRGDIYRNPYAFHQLSIESMYCLLLRSSFTKFP
ncbi:hypothetical protein SLA2020_045100 [Shorea laevis]